MAFVNFKRGTQAALQKYLASYTAADRIQATEGTFYLTEDSNRLYIGKNISSTSTPDVRAIPVNQGVRICTNVSELPIPPAANDIGSFAYISTGNILAIASGDEWVQVNTNTDHYVKERVINPSTDANTHITTISDILYVETGKNISSQYEFKGANGLTTEAVPLYELAKSGSSTTGITYYTRSGSSPNYTYTQTTAPDDGYGNVPLNNSTYYIRRGYSLTITPTTYSISYAVDSTDNGAVTLTVADTGTQTSSVQLVAGDLIEIAEDANNTHPVISAVDTSVDHLEVRTGNGGWTNQGATTTEVPNTGFYIKSVDKLNRSKGASFDPVITIGSDNNNATSVHFSNNEARLVIYTKQEIDDKLRLFNAMEYQGTATSANFPPNTPVKNGYVWMASEPLTLPNNEEVAAGDLIIATGTEDTSGANVGYIPSNAITWEHVASGSDSDTVASMTLDSNAHKVYFRNSPGGNYGQFGVLVNTDYLTATDTDSTSTGFNSRIVTIAHNTQTITPVTDTSHNNAQGASIAMVGATNASTSDTMDIPVPVLTYDGAGHITGITTYAYQVIDTHASIQNQFKSTAATALSNVNTTSSATLESRVIADSVPQAASMQFKSQTISFSQEMDNSTATGNIIMNIEWGTF